MQAHAVQQAVDYLPAWLAFGGALLVALIAAGTAQWRQRVQLRHDRELRDLDELRALLDECALAAARSLRPFLLLVARAVGTPRLAAPPEASSPESTPAPPAVDYEAAATDNRALGPMFAHVLRHSTVDDGARLPEPLDKFEDEAYEAAEPITWLYQRVVLRLGEGHDVSDALLGVQMVMASFGMLLHQALIDTEPDSDERHERLNWLRDHVRLRHFLFLEESRALVGSRIRPDRPGLVTTWRSERALRRMLEHEEAESEGSASGPAPGER